MTDASASREVWITGIGLISSLGIDAESHKTHFETGTGRVIDETRYAPYPVHPLAPLEWSKQIPKNSDQRQMETWQRIGVYAAGLALADAGIAGNPELLDRTNLVIAAGSGERDTKVDCDVLAAIHSDDETALLAKSVLPGALRPTLFLAQLSNMLAGNISIVHHVTGSSRTFMGEESGAFGAAENAFRRISSGQADIILIGGALNAEREDLLLGYEIGHNLWRGPFKPAPERSAQGGGFVPGSVGAFLTIESRAHAEARGAKAYARLADIKTDYTARQQGDIARSLTQLFETFLPHIPAGRLPVWAGSSGVEPATAEDLAFLDLLSAYDIAPDVRIYGDDLGYSVEAHFFAGLALAALTTHSEGQRKSREPKAARHALVTGTGYWRGEALALIEAIG
ncbi:MAG: beta-ketoacyl-ACP synthase [Hyphomicrobium sp.]|uniref:beta-ketoacyl-ACP synthase n=1 Tax=Hyphomicrobium sp. TaxID=82 RepID=UPI00356B1D2E